MRTEPSISESESNIFGDASGVDSTSNFQSQLLSDYRQRYGLSVDPFADDPHFPFYTGAQRRQILDQLLHLCQFSNNLLVVLGEYSVGKTRMAQALIDSLDDADDIGFVEGQINSSIESLLAEIAEQFELPDSDAFPDFVQKQSGEDGLAVLLVDNAHHLSDAVLADLIQLLRGQGNSRLHIVLFAEPHLLDRLERIDVPDVELSDFYLDKFSLTEAVDYLNFRMEMADYLGPEIFTETKVDPWWRQSQGQLLPLHEFAQEKLLASVSSAHSGMKKALPIPHIVGASVLGAALLMGYFYWGGESHPTSTIPNGKSTEVPIQSASAASLASSVVPVSSAAVSSVSTSLATQGIITSISSEAFSSVNSSVMKEKNVETVVKQSVVPLTQTNSLSQMTSAKSSKSSATTSSKAVKSADVQAAVKSAAKEASSVPEKAKAPVNVGSFSDQEKEILSWNESEFTLQLVGLSSEKAVREFVAEQPNKKDLLVFKSLRQGKDWFVVVTGRYPSSAKARQAVLQLPEQQKKASPWPRDLKTIQKEIRQK